MIRLDGHAPAPGRKLRWIVGFAAVVLLSPGCTRKKSDDFAGIPRMDFHVQESLLGSPVTDSSLRLRFRPPAFCVAADPARVEEVRRDSRTQQRPDDPLAFEPALIFGKPNSSLLCVVSRFLRPPKHGMDRAFAELCRTQAVSLAPGAEVKADFFRIGDTPVLQLVLPLPQIIQIRLVCRGPDGVPVRVDYVVPRAEYQTAMDGVESSIGSIAFF